MRLALFGATGTVGRAVVDKALAAGHDLRVLARTPAKLGAAASVVSVVTGDAKDPEAVEHAIAGADAVVSTLGGFADPDSIRIGTARITEAMTGLGMRRIVVVQGYHLDFPGDPDNFGRRLILPMLYLGSRALIPDSRAMAAAIQASGLDWTVVRVPRVTRGPSTGQIRVGSLRLGPWDSVANGDVADVVLSAVSDPAMVRRAPMVAHRRRAADRSGLGAMQPPRDVMPPAQTAKPSGSLDPTS
jgi:uncharacterized protein YbjT (DUF2867 family)